MPDNWIPPDPGPESHSVATSWLDATVHTSQSDLSFIYRDNTDTDNVVVLASSTPLDPRQNPSTSLPATLFSDLQIDDERYRSTHQQLWGVQHASGLPVSSNTPNGDQHARDAMLPSDRFGQSSSLYAPPTYQTHMHYPTVIQEPQLDGLPFRRRGPNINSIERRRERAPSFFCDFRGCNNVGFTTRASLNRHVNDKHSGKQHLCPICSRAFADSTSVGRHKRAKHEDPRVHREDMSVE